MVPRTVTLGDYRTLKRWRPLRGVWAIGGLPSKRVSECDCIKAASLDLSTSLSASNSSVSFFRKKKYGRGLLQTKFFCIKYQLRDPTERGQSGLQRWLSGGKVLALHPGLLFCCWERIQTTATGERERACFPCTS